MLFEHPGGTEGDKGPQSNEKGDQKHKQRSREQKEGEKRCVTFRTVSLVADHEVARASDLGSLCRGCAAILGFISTFQMVSHYQSTEYLSLKACYKRSKVHIE